MQEVVLSLLVLLAGPPPDGTRQRLNPVHCEVGLFSHGTFLIGLPTLDANDPENKNDPFYYDWHSLRVGGLICAGILCALGIIVLMSGKCKCKFRQKPSHRPGEGPPLITPGSAHNC